MAETLPTATSCENTDAGWTSGDSFCFICKNPLKNSAESIHEIKKHELCSCCIKIQSAVQSRLSEIAKGNNTDLPILHAGKLLVNNITENSGPPDDNRMKILEALIKSLANLQPQKIKTRCPAFNNGCSWEGSSEELTEHFKICLINLLKPTFEGYKTYTETLVNHISQLDDQLEVNQIEKKQLEQRMNRRHSIIRPQRADHSSIIKENDTEYKIPTKVPTLQEAIEEVNWQKTMNKLDNYRIKVEKIIKDGDQKEKEIVTLRAENHLLKTELEQMKKKLKSNSPSNYLEKENAIAVFKWVFFSNIHTRRNKTYFLNSISKNISLVTELIKSLI